MRPADVGADGVDLRLIDGRQIFSRDRSPLPVAAAFLTKPETSTVRVWIRTMRSGVILGCQSHPMTPPEPLAMAADVLHRTDRTLLRTVPDG